LRSAHPGGTVVCFSHADPIRSLLAHALGGPLDSMQRLSVSPCSVSAVLYRDAANPVVLLTNSSSQPLAELTAQSPRIPSRARYPALATARPRRYTSTRPPCPGWRRRRSS